MQSVQSVPKKESSDTNLTVEAVPRPPGGTPLYKLYRYVPPHRVGLLRRFGLKMGTQCLFWSGIGYGFREYYGSV